MHKKLYYTALLCSALFTISSCAKRVPNTQSFAEVTNRLTVGSFSILPPEPTGWYHVGNYGNREGKIIGAIIKKGNSDKSYIVSLTARTAKEIKDSAHLDSIDSDSSFKKAIESGMVADKSEFVRVKNLKESISVKHLKGTVCIYRDILGHDTEHQNAETHVLGYTCKNPNNPDKIVDVSDSIRSIEPIPNNETEKLLEKVMSTLVFD